MTIFNLPDLGEGLPDAEIHEWFVKEGDIVTVDQPLVAMETAKAVVEVPSPQAGKILKFYGKPGDIIKTGDPLVAFASEKAAPPSDKGTVVGALEEAHEVSEDTFTVGASEIKRNRTTPAVRVLAKKLGVDVSSIQGSGDYGVITQEDVKRAAKAKPSTSSSNLPYEPLRGVRRAMLHSMVQSHQEVVPVSIFDEADVQAWHGKEDITVRLIQAIVEACKEEPALNAWYDNDNAARFCAPELNLGLAMDNEEGLFVPVIKNAAQYTQGELRKIIDTYKAQVSQRTIPPENLKEATFTLSNFGKFAGRFASPIIVPPMVAILAVGRLYQGAVVVQGKVEAHWLLPLSLSFDHRAVTGGEATRFLGVLLRCLQKAL